MYVSALDVVLGLSIRAYDPGSGEIVTRISATTLNPPASQKIVRYVIAADNVPACYLKPCVHRFVSVQLTTGQANYR